MTSSAEPPDGFCHQHHGFGPHPTGVHPHGLAHPHIQQHARPSPIDDEPGWAWPAWKFGLRRDDLFGSLHERYNTFTSTIQDPEAFHHDVCELSHAADTPAEFHRLMADRQAQRLRELNESLESAAFEIIANPDLIGTEQWSFAIQLFRTKSLDSLVRYFSSYLPEGYFAKRGGGASVAECDVSSTGSSFAETACSADSVSTRPSTVGEGEDHEAPSFFDDGDDKPTFTHEPFDITSTMQARYAQRSLDLAANTQLPPSPRSMTTRSDDSPAPASLADHVEIHDYAIIAAATPARTLSFSGSESDRFAPAASLGCCHRDGGDDDALDTSQSDFEEMPLTSVSDLTESTSSLDSVAISNPGAPLADFAKDSTHLVVDDDEDELPPAQMPYDIFDSIEEPMEVMETPMESETPTPRQEARPSTSYIDSKMLQRSVQAHQRATSPRPSSRARAARREGSPLQRRSPDESLSRVQKTVDAVRSRPKVRRWAG